MNSGHFDIATATHIGYIRKENQDRTRVFPVSPAPSGEPQGWGAAVADGMGGHRAGAVAAETAVSIVSDELAVLGDHPLDGLNRTARKAFEAIQIRCRMTPECSDMGTTLSVLLLINGRGYAMHIGDSRIYQYRAGELTQITRDHSVVAEMVRSGLITAAQARTHPDGNVLIKALSGINFIEPDIYEPFVLEAGDRYLLCTDGLWNMVADDIISKYLALPGAQQVCEALINAALDRGGRDNVAVIVIRVL